MAKLLDSIIIIDVESTCWDEASQQGTSEIIEIGVAQVSVSTGDIVQSESILIKPSVSRVSEFCTNLTTLTQEQLDTHGISFEEACDILKKKYKTHLRTWGSYGDYDRTMFEKQCRSFGVKYPFSKTHINVKNLYAVLYGLKKEVGMSMALEQQKFNLEGTHHRGEDDAKNIAKIVKRILLGDSLSDIGD